MILNAVQMVRPRKGADYRNRRLAASYRRGCRDDYWEFVKESGLVQRSKAQCRSLGFNVAREG